MKPVFRRYAAVLAIAAAFIVFLFLLPSYRDKAVELISFQAETMLLVIPPIFVLLGLLDVWVPREQMMRFMGPGSGARGAFLRFSLAPLLQGHCMGLFRWPRC